MLDKSKIYLFYDATHCEAFIRQAGLEGQSVYAGSWIHTPTLSVFRWPHYMAYFAEGYWRGGYAGADVLRAGVYYAPKLTVLPW